MIFYTHECEEKIGYTFKDKCILRTCFTHPSYANEHNEQSYETLEYLGDSILNFVVADFLFRNSKGDEGDLTKKRADIVSATPIGNAVKAMGVEQYILLGEGEKNKPIKFNMCSDLFESIIAGIYLDGGFECSKKFIYDKLLRNISRVKGNSAQSDCKSKLQEYVQKRKLGKIEYKQVNKTGPDHAPEFTCSVYINNKLAGENVGGYIPFSFDITSLIGSSENKID